ncbi:MAG TPA: DUF5652 family protein [Candidatus Nanoarchaeia archaeon]|nr:DUF5652 family protein [Candidatus Nanoarchaeia archaeon]
MTSFLETLASQFGIPIWLLIMVLAWSLFWKAIALWKSARNNHFIWFVAFLIIHTLGILEILYIFLFSKIKLPGFEKKPSKKRKK